MHFFLFGAYLALLGMLARALIEAGLPPARAGLAVAGWLCAAAVGNRSGAGAEIEVEPAATVKAAEEEVRGAPHRAGAT